MKTNLGIVNFIEKNPVTRLSKDYQSKFVNKIKASFTDTQQQLYTASLYCYLNYDSKNDFVIDLDDIWKWIGFSSIDPAKRLIVKFFTKDIDYKIVFHRSVENLKRARPANKH